LEKGFTEEIPEHGHGHGDRRQTATFAAAEVAEYGGCLVNSSSDEFCIGTMGGVPVTAVEDSEGFIIIRVCNRFVKANKSDFIVDLSGQLAGGILWSVKVYWGIVRRYLQIWSGRHLVKICRRKMQRRQYGHRAWRVRRCR
jgi:hypothetical protein